ncbi:spore germination protein [Paenibacillus wynnii]|uniref:spore germination protein n=1 Tax=Paenibacillus wynnii TaxID=268407 RepID=UPI00278FA3EB|nr:spore germination protein [Paenibacillus wynnii]MDQ0191678.1 hypothetical protein [Paenibacillus wynnii]
MGQKIFPDLKRNEEQLRLIYDKCSDVVFRQFTIQGTIPMLLIYIDGLSDKTAIEKQVIAPLMWEENNPSLQLQQLVEQTIDVSQVEECCDFPRVTELLSSGSVVLLRDSESVAVSLHEQQLFCFLYLLFRCFCCCCSFLTLTPEICFPL